jgi:hypothetical protein
MAAEIQAEFERGKIARDAAAAAARAKQKAEVERAARARAACDAELRRKAVVFNSAWDGSVYQVEQYLKRRLKDPDSFDAIGWGAVSRSCTGYTVGVRYRARNSFGGMVIEEQFFDLDTAGNVTSMTP